MAIILNIDTAVAKASICLADDDVILDFAENDNTRDHAAWLHSEIDRMMQRNGLKLAKLDALAVSIGPGSYTGLRVGLAAVKGLCFALEKPLITLNTLKVMAAASVDGSSSLLCPMIDARRMEVFTAVYDQGLQERVPPVAMVIDENSFAQLLEENEIIFSGNGSVKLRKVVAHRNARYSEVVAGAKDMRELSSQYFKEKQFASLAYTEPFYLKEFYTGSHK